jgi:hypothetical protein
VTFNEVVSDWMNERIEPGVSVTKVDFGSEPIKMGNVYIGDVIEIKIYTVNAKGTTGMLKANSPQAVLSLMCYLRDHWSVDGASE